MNNVKHKRGTGWKSFGFILPLIMILTPAFAEDSVVAGLRHRRLIWTDNPQERALVCWDTPVEGANHRVYYDTVSRKGVVNAYKNSQVATANGAYAREPGKKGGEKEAAKPDLYYHHAQLTGLKPGTTYYFVMASGPAVSDELHFRTAPAADEPLKIIFGGDSRTGRDTRQKINRLIAKTAAEDDSVLAFAHGGDYVVSGSNLTKWKLWLDDHELTITSQGRILPLIPARGNHESRGPLYDQIFGSPGGVGKNYYATQLSPEVLLITLNNCINTGGAQKEFLKASLEKAANIRWRVAQYHIPVYPAVKKQRADKGLADWVPLFETFNLALACEADGHCIKRTVPIRDGKEDPTGVIYIG